MAMQYLGGNEGGWAVYIDVDRKLDQSDKLDYKNTCSIFFQTGEGMLSLSGM